MTTYTRCGKRSRAKSAPKTGKSYIAPITGAQAASLTMARLRTTPQEMRDLYRKLTADGLPGKFIAI